MSFWDILGIVVIFGITLYIGWKATAQTKTADDFLMAHRSLGKIQAGFSMAATDIGGNAVVGAVAYAYACGLGGAWYNWGAVFPMLILAFLLAKQLRGINVVSVPELLGRRYSSPMRLISTIAQLLAIGASLGIQFTVAATSISAISGMSYTLALVISVVVVVLYTMGGGLLAVVNTDVFQFIVICATIAVVIPASLAAGGGWSAISQTLPDGFLDIGSQGIMMPLSLGLLYMFDYATNQHILQRVFSAKDANTAKFAFTFTGIMYGIFGLAVAFIGVLCFALLPDLGSEKLAYATLIKEYMPVGIRGLALGGIFVAAMSTADSKIIAASTLFVNDIYQPYIKKGATIDDKHMLTVSRMSTLLVCVVGIGVALVSDSLIQMMYVAGLFYGTAVFVPMLAALYWKRGTASAAMVSMLAAMVVGLYDEYFIYGVAEGILGAIPSNLVAFITSLLLFMVISVLTPKPTEGQLSVITDKLV